jgi:hypothetical protein
MIDGQKVRENFILEEKAASSYECGLAMDRAAIRLAERTVSYI